MDTKSLLSYLREKAYPAFRAPHFQAIPTTERRLVGAVLGSLKHDDLASLVSALQEDAEAPQYLIEEVKWYMTRTRKGAQNTRMNPSKNYSTGTLTRKAKKFPMRPMNSRKGSQRKALPRKKPS